jgi:tRNA(fMet)-specific endonuclease VapC
MILLDTDHLSVLTDARDPRHELLSRRLEAAEQPVACTIISVEEVFRGWLAFVGRQRDVHRQVPAYARLGQFLDVLSDWEVVPFDEGAADRFAVLRRHRIRIGTMDLKIASIALVNDALLVSANKRDFSIVPGSLCESWLLA